GAEGRGRRMGGQAGAPARVPAVLARRRAAEGRADRLVAQAGDCRAGRPGPAAARPGRFPAAGRHRRAGDRAAGGGAEHRGGWAGLLDLGYVAFFGFGAYGFALLSSSQLGANGIHLPYWLSLPIVMVGAALLGLAV